MRWVSSSESRLHGSHHPRTLLAAGGVGTSVPKGNSVWVAHHEIHYRLRVLGSKQAALAKHESARLRKNVVGKLRGGGR